MPRLTVDPSGTHVLRDGRFLPLIIETAWSAFADPTEADWRTYLEVRRRQGFTCVLISALPVPHDRERTPGAREPFHLDAGGDLDFSRPDDAFFAEARRYVRIAQAEYGFEVMITVLWNNYLPGTWGAGATPAAVMPVGARRRFVATVAETFADLEPVFVVGGDDAYDVPGANAAYLEAVAHLRAVAPDCLLTTHTAPHAVLPDALADALDLHLHQSGHNAENQELTWRQAEPYLARSPRRPLIASEPPYEQHGIVNGHGRWTRDDVRRASWTSVLAGATAGIGYGAHGTWMWHRPGGEFQARGPSLEPFAWQEALAFPGALDISLMARLFTDHRLHRLLPAQGSLGDDHGGTVRLAAGPDLVALYLPFPVDADVRLDLAGYRITGWDLAARAPLVPDTVASAGGTLFRQQNVPVDVLYLGERPS